MSLDSIKIFPHLRSSTGEISPHWLGEYGDVGLEKLKVIIIQQISPELLDTQVDFSLHASFLADSILCRVQGHIWAEQLAQYIVEYPTDWWQAFKARFFPAWALRRWPVRKTRHEIDLKAIYPKLCLIRPNGPYRVIAFDYESKD